MNTDNLRERAVIVSVVVPVYNVENTLNVVLIRLSVRISDTNTK